MVSQPSPGFMQTRGSSNFAFSSAPGQQLQQQQATAMQLQQQHGAIQQHSNGSSNPTSLQHLGQASGLGGSALGGGTSASDVGLDPNDFPALGSSAPTSGNNNHNSTGGSAAPATSYASQAGSLTVGAGTIGASSGTGVQQRDFTQDDFPALGGQHGDGPQPSGLNGFQNADGSQHRQGLLGSLGGSASLQAPGMLGMPQTRNIHPGFQQSGTESDKQQRVSFHPILSKDTSVLII
jgi:CCR4-NOT transcription complex subunit 2